MTINPGTFDVDQLRADIAAGRSSPSIAREWQVSDKAVRNALKRHGIVRPPAGSVHDTPPSRMLIGSDASMSTGAGPSLTSPARRNAARRPA
jgi:hypothetical protein